MIGMHAIIARGKGTESAYRQSFEGNTDRPPGRQAEGQMLTLRDHVAATVMSCVLGQTRVSLRYVFLEVGQSNVNQAVLLRMV